MNKKTIYLCLCVFLSACSAVPIVVPQVPDTSAQTQIAFFVEQTLLANQQQAIGTEIAELTQVALQPTNTPHPTDTITPTYTPSPSYTPSSTFTPSPTPTLTPTPKPTATSTPLPCNWAGFVKDMTVADGALFPANSKFTKVWRLKNIGSCSWTKDYELVYFDGKKMGGSPISLPKKVSPGETIDIALPLQAPADKGSYKGYWILRDANGKNFGVGANADNPIWVQIKVSGDPPRFSYDFAYNFWQATWKTDHSTLYPNGTSVGYNNYVIYTNVFQMESGKWEDEPAIIVNIESEERVRGTFPSYKVKSGDHFVSQIGCIFGSPDCKMKMVLSYRIKGTNNSVILGSWTEAYNGDTTKIDIDLSSLTGKDVIFTFDMESKSQATANEVFWFVPSIRN